MNNIMVRFFTPLLCVLLSGCMVGPDYKEPKNQVASHWKKQDSSVKEKRFHDATWWSVFHDPVLTSIIHQGYHNNLSLQIASVRVLQARAQLAQTVGQMYPQQQEMTGNFSYNRLGGSSLESVLPSNFDAASLGFSANWELDFWGKYRRAVQANDAAFLASVASYDNVLVTLISDIARSYVKIRTTEQLIVVTKANIVVQKMGLKIALARYNAGQVSLVDVDQAKTELAQTEASLPPLVTNLQTQKDNLSLLLGTVPNGLDGTLQKNHGIPKAPKTVAVGIPKEMLVRRPDVYQARMDAVAQSANIGAVKANLYPSLSLAGTFALSSTSITPSSLSEMFNLSNSNVSAGPNLSWPLFNYGQITNAVRVQDAVFQQTLLNYKNVVLKAQQEVQDTITAYIEAKKSVYYLNQANSSATESLKLALIRYKEGETDFTPVLNAEQQLLKVETSLVNAQGDVPQAIIALYRALGGGWQIRGTHDVVPAELKAEMAARTDWGTLLQQKEHQAPMNREEKIQQLYIPKW